MSAPRSVLVHSMEEISGDGLIKLPFLAGMRAAFPGARLSWCAASGRSVYGGWLAPVAGGLMDELILAEPPPGRRFDVVVDTQQNLRRALRLRRALAPGGRFIAPAAGFLLSSRRPQGPRPEAMADQLAGLLRLAAGESARPQPLALPDAPRRALAQALLPDGPTYVGFAPGAGGAERRWPLDRYLALARRQHERGRRPVFLLGPAERDYLAPIRAQAPYAQLPAEDGDVPEALGGPLLTIALATRLAGAMAADAGPGHMLAAGGAPLLSLFREHRKARKFPPAAPRLAVLVAQDWGGPAIDRIPLEAADAALERLLAAP